MSSVTGAGVAEFFEAVDASRAEYEKYAASPRTRSFFFCFYLMCLRREYLPELRRAREAREQSLKAVKDESLSRFMRDLAVDRERNPAAAAADRWDPSAEGDGEDDEDDDPEVNIIDRSEFPPLADVRHAC